MIMIGKAVIAANNSTDYALVGIGPQGNCPFLVLPRPISKSFSRLAALPDEHAIDAAWLEFVLPGDGPLAEQAKLMRVGLARLRADGVGYPEYLAAKDYLLQTFASTAEDALKSLCTLNVSTLTEWGHLPKLLTYQELSPEAQERAIRDERNFLDFDPREDGRLWQDMPRETIVAVILANQRESGSYTEEGKFVK